MPAPKSRGLGRGLGELIRPTNDTQGHVDRQGRANNIPDGTEFLELPVEQITANAHQPRTAFDADTLTELSESIKEVGLLQPVVVRPSGDGYELIMGERRLRATKMAGLKRIPAIVRGTADDDMLRDALLENLHRVQLNPLEEAAAYQQMLDDFGCTQAELSERIKRSRPQISNTLRLLKLHPAVQKLVASGALSAGHARALVVAEASDQERLARRIIDERLSVRATEKLIMAATERREPTPRPKQPRRVITLQQQLGGLLETGVKVQLDVRGRGKIAIEVKNEDELRRVLELIDPELRY